MMTIRKVVFGAGVAVSIVGVAFAGERSRGTSGDAISGGSEVAPAVTRMVAPGIAKRTVGGIETTAVADGSVRLSDVIAEHDSVERYNFDQEVSNTPMMKASDGSTVFGNGAVGFFADLLGPNAPVKPMATTAEEYKQTSQYTEQVFGNESVIAFPDGATFLDALSSEPLSSVRQRTMPSISNGSGSIFADGAITQ